jgi:hypothetical protein
LRLGLGMAQSLTTEADGLLGRAASSFLTMHLIITTQGKNPLVSFAYKTEAEAKGLAGHRERDLGNAACDSSMTGGSFPLGAPMPPSSVASSRNNAGAGRSAMDVDLCQELAAGVTSTSSWPELPNSCRM